MNPLAFALNMELDGKAYYEQLAAETADQNLKKIFHSLAQDEQKHLETIQAISEQQNVSMIDSAVLQEAQNLFQTLLAEGKSSVQLSKDLAVYQHAMIIEAKSQKFYEDLALQERNPAVSGLFLKIANEEKNHFIVMDNIYTFMLAPYNFLAWGEFSNLTEYY